MWRATLSSLLAHKVRLALTTLAIVLGVAFVSGTLIFTDTGRSAFNDVFDTIGENIDLTVRGVSELNDVGDGAGAAAFAAPPAVDPETVDRIAAVDGVAAVDPYVDGSALVLDADGEPIGAQGAPMMGVNAPTVEELTSFELRDGRYPEAPDEVALDAATAGDQRFEVGDTVRVAADGPAEFYEIVGVVGFGEGVDNLAGASLTVFAPDTAFDLFAVDGGYAGVDVLAAGNADVAELQDRIAAAVGNDYEVVTSGDVATEGRETVDAIMGPFSSALLIFAGVSLLVGAFIINNTFAIVIAQRSRELALLRAVGASRRQVLGSVLLEALVVGVIGSIAGVALGVVVASGLQHLLSAFAIELPDAELVFAARTVAVGLGVGIGITLLSALAPATKALRVPPVAAMQAVAVPTKGRVGRVRTVFGLLLAVAGLGLLGLGLFVDAGMPAVLGGALALLLGAALLARYVVQPLLKVLGWPVARLGVRGTLAQENAVRNPQRTAATASALMIGLGLVTFALIFGASLRGSFESTIDEQFASDLQIRSETFGPMPNSVQGDIERLPQVASVADMRLGQVGIDDRVVSAAAVEPDKLDTAWNLEVVDGSLERFGDGGIVVANDTAEEIGVTAGDTLDVTFPRTGVQPLTVQAIVDNETSSYYIDEETFLDNATDEGPLTLYVSLADGVTVADARPAVESVTGAYAALGVQDSEDMRRDIRDQVNQALGLMSALLGLSIVIALFGIANTLSLSVFERVREFGLLRAVGATRDQVRSVVRWESVLIAVLGALFGIAVGTIFGWMSVRALAEDGFTVFAFPAVQVVAGVAGAAVAGMLAAVLPARRAARVDVLRAVAAD